jgi:hypothetical protein
LATLWGPIPRADAPLGDTLNLILELDIRGTVLDTLGRIPSERAAVFQGETQLRYYYRGKVEFLLCGDLWVGRSDDYRLSRYGSTGQVERVVTLERERMALDGRDESVMMAWFDENLKANRVPVGRAADIKSRVRFESTYPAFRTFVCGPESTLLVQRFHLLRDIEPTKENNPLRVGTNTALRPPPSDTWDLFDPGGRYLGVVSPPWDQVWRMGQFVPGPDGTWYMYAVMQDELDVEYVVGWRVEGRMPT